MNGLTLKERLSLSVDKYKNEQLLLRVRSQEKKRGKREMNE